MSGLIISISLMSLFLFPELLEYLPAVLRKPHYRVSFFLYLILIYLYIIHIKGFKDCLAQINLVLG